jgi:hypothetical protein
MTNKTIELDEHRGMAAQKATDLRRLLADVEANEAALRLRQDELETQLIAAPAANWEEAAGKARYLLNLFAATRPRKTHAGKHSSRPCSLIFGGSRPSPSEQPGNCAAELRQVWPGRFLGPRSANGVTESWRSIFPIEAAHGAPCGFGGMTALWRLLVNQDALKRIEPGIGADEAGFLGAFDSHCDLIHAVAVKIYRRARKGSYD